MTSQILIKQDFDNYSEKIFFCEKEVLSGRGAYIDRDDIRICHLLLDMDTADDDLDIHEE